MTGHNLNQPDTAAPAGAAVCWLCTQHSTRTEHHELEADHYQVRDCATATGAGVRLCPMCHTAVHRWMHSHGTPETGAASTPLDAVLSRFATALLA